MSECSVIKRSGKEELFDQAKIAEAIEGAFEQVEAPEENVEAVLEVVCDQVLTLGDLPIKTETINDLVEKAFMELGFYDEAKNFILYREEIKKIHSMSAGEDAMAEYVFTSRYARYLPGENRRETWDEAVDRVREMHLRKYKDKNIDDDIYWAFERVREKKVLPSLRSMQFGGKPIEDNHSRLYNCCYSPLDNMAFFRESMFLLLSGCGVGMSVEFSNINQLPPMKTPNPKNVVHYQIEDSIEGWSDAIDTLVSSYVEGVTVEFLYDLIRPQGAPIGSGGKAPGHIPLRRALEKIRSVLDAVGDRQLKPIEAFDIVMHQADAVLAGGVRRSALCTLFSPDDHEMANSKIGDWFTTHPQRARSNNSVKLIRDKTSKEQFQRIFETQKEFGEPGFFFVSDSRAGTNPCFEVGFLPYLPKGYTLHTGETLREETSGFQKCNLTTMNGAKLKTFEDFKEATKAATIIGTLQAGYTDFKYLRPISKDLCDREALLGVSITGMMDSPEVTMNPEYQREMAKYAIEVNAEFARKISINASARLTVVKPEGTSSLVLNTASGIHPRYAQRYFRRVQANTQDPVYQHFKDQNPGCCEPSVYSANKTDDVITFCVEAPKGAITKEDVSAIEFLEQVKSTQQNWVIPGTGIPDSAPGVLNNVSNTVVCKSEDWDKVCDYIYDNREFFTGVALLPDETELGTIYQQAPHETVHSHDDEAMWASLTDSYSSVDYTELEEEDDNTAHKETVACGAGGCDLI